MLLKQNWLIFLLFGFLVCALLAGTLITYKETSYHILQQYQQRQLLLSRSAMEGIKGLIDGMLVDLQHLSQYPQVAENDPEGIRQIFSLTWQAKQGFVGNVTRVNEDGILLYTYPEDEKALGQDITYQTHIKKLLATRNPVISSPFLSVQGYLGISIHYPLFNQEGQFKGSAAYLLPFDFIKSSYLQPLYSDLPEGDIILLDQEGFVLSSRQPELLNLSYRKAFPDASDEEMTQLHNSLQLKGTFLGQLADREHKALYYAISTTPIVDKRWAIMVMSPRRALFRGIKRLSSHMYLLFLIIILSMTFLFQYILRQRLKIAHVEEQAAMVDVLEKKVQERTQELQALTENLERRVEERTAELRQAQQYLANVINSLGELLFVIDLEAKIKFLNNAALTFLRTSREHAVGVELWKVGDALGLSEANIRAFLQRLEDRRYPHSILRELPGASGDKRYFEFFIHPLVLDGSLQGAVLLMVDITEQKLVEQNLMQAQKMDSLGVLAGGLAHQFNNMLTCIMGYVSLCKSSLDPSSQEHEFLTIIENSALGVRDLVRKLLGLSRKTPPELKPVDLTHVVNDTLTLVEKTIPPRIKVVTKLDIPLPPIDADVPLLQQALLNLIINAMEAISQKGEIQIGAEPVQLDEAFCQHYPAIEPGQFVRLSISDTGKGISPQELTRVFEPFFTTKQEGEGTGLGLSITYSVVRNHNGLILADSQLGKGSTFTIYLPVSRHPIVPGEQKPTFTQRMKDVLIIEDEETLAHVLADFLQQQQLSTSIAHTIKEALEYLSRQRPDLIILAITFPEREGDQLLSAIRQKAPQIPLIVLASSPDLAQLRKKIPGAKLLSKPLNLAQILDTIRQLEQVVP